MARHVALLLLVIGACSSSKKDTDEPLLSEQQRAELKAFVEDQMAKVPGQARLDATQIEDIRPFVKASTTEIFVAAQKYHADPTPKNLKRFTNDAQRIRKELSETLKPLMTSAQRYNFMTVYDQALQEIRQKRMARG